MKNSNGTRCFSLGFALGAAVAMLFAPKSGAETRGYCQTKTRETADSLRRQAEALRERALKNVDRRKQAFQQQMNKLSAAVDAGTKAYKKAS